MKLQTKYHQKPVETKEINLDPKYSEKNPTFAYIKDKYFNFFKTIMCPLKEQCPFLEPRWPHSDKSASTPYGSACPYAHQISELKFGQEISEKIKCRKDLLKKMKKEEKLNQEKENIENQKKNNNYNNTYIYIGLGILALVGSIILYKVIKKK